MTSSTKENKSQLGDPPKQKDRWDKADIVSKFLIPVLGSVLGAVLAFNGNTWISELQRRSAVEQTSLELQSKREEAETALRSAMFTHVIDKYAASRKDIVASSEQRAKDQLLYLEVLVENFHESMNLSPLFSSLYRQIDELKASNIDVADLSSRIDDLATKIREKQKLALINKGDSVDFELKWDTANQINGKRLLSNRFMEDDPFIQLQNTCYYSRGCLARVVIAGCANSGLPSITYVQISISRIDSARNRIKVRAYKVSGQDGATRVKDFWLKPYDFPMIDNIRLADGVRLALVLGEVNTFSRSASISLIAFPDEYASMKERPYISEFADKLQQKISTSGSIGAGLASNGGACMGKIAKFANPDSFDIEASQKNVYSAVPS